MELVFHCLLSSRNRSYETVTTCPSNLWKAYGYIWKAFTFNGSFKFPHTRGKLFGILNPLFFFGAVFVGGFIGICISYPTPCSFASAESHKDYYFSSLESKLSVCLSRTWFFTETSCAGQEQYYPSSNVPIGGAKRSMIRTKVFAIYGTIQGSPFYLLYLNCLKYDVCF